ncbi:MAG: TM2 domain-containing membrane protein YozV [Cellvibrionaceae bacterium]|jgi:TM2 domain-containing membrane protein YozV
MKRSTKALGLSAFLFPGSGHLYLGYYIRGLILLVIAAIGLLMFTSAMFEIVWAIASDIETGKATMDEKLIQILIDKSLSIYEQPQMKLVKWLITATWLIGILDTWRAVRRQEAVTIK